MEAYYNRKLPLGDLHRHITGSLRTTTIIDLAKNNNLPLPANTASGLARYINILEPAADLADALSRFSYIESVIATYDDCRRIAKENIEDAILEGLDFVELRFSPLGLARKSGLEMAEIIKAIAEGMKEGDLEKKIKSGLICGLNRGAGEDACLRETKAILECRDYLVGADILAADTQSGEMESIGKCFINSFKKLRDSGLKITAHAGESGGPENIWRAINELGAIRIGHGVTARNDKKLIDYLGENNICIECNITSNIHTSAIKTIKEHPIKFFLENGLNAAICTDDPGLSLIDINWEYKIAREQLGLNDSQIDQVQKNAVSSSFI